MFDKNEIRISTLAIDVLQSRINGLPQADRIMVENCIAEIRTVIKSYDPVHYRLALTYVEAADRL